MAELDKERACEFGIPCDTFTSLEGLQIRMMSTVCWLMDPSRLRSDALDTAGVLEAPTGRGGLRRDT
eukprot:753200-Hanusia_phi.AAC.4